MFNGKGFRIVGRVEIKTETTPPGESIRNNNLHENNNNNTMGKNSSQTKTEFTICENGGILHGPNYDFHYILSKRLQQRQYENIRKEKEKEKEEEGDQCQQQQGRRLVRGEQIERCDEQVPASMTRIPILKNYSTNNQKDNVEEHEHDEIDIDSNSGQLEEENELEENYHPAHEVLRPENQNCQLQQFSQQQRQIQRQKERENENQHQHQQYNEDIIHDEDNNHNNNNEISMIPITPQTNTNSSSPLSFEQQLPDIIHLTRATEYILPDSRASMLNVIYVNNEESSLSSSSYPITSSTGRFCIGPSVERFSGHTGICRVLGSRKLPIVPHNLQLGDFLRIGSVGLIVCEINRTIDPNASKVLDDSKLNKLKQRYLSIGLLNSMNKHNTAKKGTSDSENQTDAKLDGEDEEMIEDTSSDEEDEDNERYHNSEKIKPTCYICYDDEQDPVENPLVAPCKCKGDTKYIHVNCLLRWNNDDYDTSEGGRSTTKVCAVTNTDGLDVCSICKATYLTSVKLKDGRRISLLARKLPPPYITFAVVTQHETRSRATTLTNTRFQLSFANFRTDRNTSTESQETRTSSTEDPYAQGSGYLTIGRSTSNHMTLRYRTVSQMHAKVKFLNGLFYLIDTASSNGTMLYLSRPLEMQWNKVYHIKMGRTIVTLKAKKRWKWMKSKPQSPLLPSLASNEGDQKESNEVPDSTYLLGGVEQDDYEREQMRQRIRLGRQMVQQSLSPPQRFYSCYTDPITADLQHQFENFQIDDVLGEEGGGQYEEATDMRVALLNIDRLCYGPNVDIESDNPTSNIM